METFIFRRKKDAELLVWSVEMFATDQLPAFERSTVNCVYEHCTTKPKMHKQNKDAKPNQICTNKTKMHNQTKERITDKKNETSF